jgi:hypothetical protein
MCVTRLPTQVHKALLASVWTSGTLPWDCASLTHASNTSLVGAWLERYLAVVLGVETPVARIVDGAAVVGVPTAMG